MKRWQYALIILCLLFALCAGTALAESSHITLGTGSCGDAVNWEVWQNAEGVITLDVSGNGPVTMPVSFRPWEVTPPPAVTISPPPTPTSVPEAQSVGRSVHYSYDDVSRIVVNEGVTSICDNAFRSFYRVVEIELPASCLTVGQDAFCGGSLFKLTLTEGLRIIEPYAFNAYHEQREYSHQYCLSEIPRSVEEIGKGALETVVPAVYRGTEGESYCIDWAVPDYVLIDEAESGALRASRLALLEAVVQVEDVPLRYRLPAIAALSKMNLTADQCVALRDYVLDEEQALQNAMYDNTMTATEITSFLSRFIATTRSLGVTTSYNITTINGYPGVALTVTVNGKATALDVYRTGMQWTVHYVEPEDENDFLYVETEGGVMITDYVGDDVTALTFPATLDGKPVVSIRGNNYPRTLTSVVIPEGVKRLERFALSYLDSLSSVSLPDSLEVIADHAFDDCSALKSVSFGTHLRVLGDAFIESGVTSVSLPASLETLGRTFDQIEVDPANPHFQSDQGALYNKDTHTLIYYPRQGAASYTVLPDTLHIMGSVFEGNTAIEAVLLPEGLIDIGDYAFKGCSNLSYVVLPNSVETIGYRAYEGVTMTQLHIPGRLFSGSQWDYLEEGELEHYNILLENIKSFQPNLDQIVNFTVGAGNRYLSSPYGVLLSADEKVLVGYPAGRSAVSYTVPAGTLSIASEAFQGSALTQITLPDSLMSLGYRCFDNVPLQSLTIPEGLTHLNNLGTLTSLTRLTLPASMNSWDYSWHWTVTPSQLIIIGYPDSRAVEFASDIGCKFQTIGDSVQTIVLDSQRLTVVLGETATVTAQTTGGPASVLNWHEQTQNTSGLLEFNEPYGATVTFQAMRPGTTTLMAAAGQAQAACTVDVVLPQNAPGDVVFLPADLSVIEPNAFAGTDLRRVIIPGGVTSIGSRAFYNCESLLVVQIPDSVRNIAINAFDGCDQLVIVCGANGFARNYAEAHDIPYCIMN